MKTILLICTILMLSACGGGDDEATSLPPATMPVSGGTASTIELTATQIVLEASRVPPSPTAPLSDTDIQATQIVVDATRGAVQTGVVDCPEVDFTTSFSLSLNMQSVIYDRAQVTSQELAAPCDDLDTLLYAFEVALVNDYTPETLATEVERIVAVLASLPLPVDSKSLLITVPQYASEAGMVSGRVFRDVDAAVRDYNAGLRGADLLAALGGFIAD